MKESLMMNTNFRDVDWFEICLILAWLISFENRMHLKRCWWIYEDVNLILEMLDELMNVKIVYMIMLCVHVFVWLDCMCMCLYEFVFWLLLSQNMHAYELIFCVKFCVNFCSVMVWMYVVVWVWIYWINVDLCVYKSLCVRNVVWW